MNKVKRAEKYFEVVKATSGKRVGVLFYILTSYVLLQFTWWAYLLIDLNKALYASEGESVVRNRVLMVLGEGAVFLVFLLAGIFIMQRTIRKEIGLVRQQRNFLLSITHELKTPVAIIKLCLQTLYKRDNLDIEQRRPLQKSALENTDRLHTLIDNVLLVTRIESNIAFLNLERADLTALTKEITARLNAGFSEKNVFLVECQDGCEAKVDRSAFESILLNLLENALKYGGNNGVSVSLRKKSDQILLEVSDGGPGIPDSEKSRVFTKFYRMGNEETRSRKGTGLGLFIVSELVSLLGGRLTLRDNTPSGSVFSVYLPTSARSR